MTTSIQQEVNRIIGEMMRDGVITMHTDHQAVDQLLETPPNIPARKAPEGKQR